MVIGALFGVSLLLLLASLTQPWFTASFYSGSSEIHGTYWFEHWRYQSCANDVCGDPGPLIDYQDSAWESLMETSKVLVGLGMVGVAGFGILLGLYYYGYLEKTGFIKVAWLVGFVGILLGITYFALNAGGAGARQLEELVRQRGFSGFGPVEDKFWGSQPYANGELVSAPGVGWLLAILALVNMVPPTILLYQFPEREESPVKEDYALDDEDAGPAPRAAEF